MKTNRLLLGLLCICVTLVSCQNSSKDYTAKVEDEIKVPTKEEKIRRGEYLVMTIGCDHCHTPKKMTDQGPVPDLDRWMMGHPADATLPKIDPSQIGPGKWLLFHGDLTAAVGPWGISYGANLTPHETGIGNWSFEQFRKAMTEGKYKGMDGGRPIMPPMPWQSFKELKGEDLRAIYEYLMSIKPIDNVVPAYTPPDRIQ
ncbi:MAG: c-type cytochrome [Flavobacteriaceae bacterium]|nr:c-type cytochrome [Flavobacteriaceae bacterium]